MATPFSVVYDFFLAKITDYSFANFTENELEEELELYLRTACSKFMSAETRLRKNHDTKMFETDLSDLEVQILSLLMVVEYLNPKIIATENMKQYLASKEYRMYSQANHLSTMINLKNEIRSEVNHLMTLYTYRDGIGGFQ